MKTQTIRLLLAFSLSAFPLYVLSQPAEYSLRSSVNLEIKIARGLKFELAPEFRSSPGSISSCLIQAGLSYRLASWLSVGGYYRLNGSKVPEPESVDGPSYDFSNRFALEANTKINLKRFTPKFRVRYCNFSDFDSQTDNQTNFLRYRFGLDYNIKGIKLTPFAAIEFYQKLSSGLFSKSRYTLGGEFEFNKKNAISFGYSFDDKFKTLTNYHIFELTYSFKF